MFAVEAYTLAGTLVFRWLVLNHALKIEHRSHTAQLPECFFFFLEYVIFESSVRHFHGNC
jgi:hypothetical protein